MSLLSDEEISKMVKPYGGDSIKGYDHVKAFARAIEVAILAKLAAKELPEPQKYPADCFMREVNVCDALAVSIAIKQAHAQGFAAGAAAQLAQEPLCYVRNGEINRWNGLSGMGFSGPLYTRRESK